jgi:hypothetical protein
VRRADRVGGLLLLVFGLWYAAVAHRQYTYWAPTGPGSGFLPFWLGVALAALAVLLLAQAARRQDPGPAWLPEGAGLRRLLAVLAATVAFVAAMKPVGMILGTVLFLVVVLRFIERQGWPATLGIALATTGLNYLVFTYWLRVPFPRGPLGF